MGDARAAHIAPPTIPRGLAAAPGPLAPAAGPAGAAALATAWHDATIAGCLRALEGGGPVDGGAFEPVPAPEAELGSAAPTETWRHREAPIVRGAVTLPGPAGERRLCDGPNARHLAAGTVNAVQSDVLDRPEAARDARRHGVPGSRHDEDGLTGSAALRSTFLAPPGRWPEVTFVAQPADGRLGFPAVEASLPEDR